MLASALVFGQLLAEFTQLRLIKVVQSAAVATMLLNGVALWKQEARAPRGAVTVNERSPRFSDAWRAFASGGRAVRLLVAVALGTAAFGMQDILLEPYGGEILRLGVGATTMLTALTAAGALLAFGLSAHALERGVDPLRLAASGAVAGVLAFALVIFAAPLGSAALFRAGAAGIGFGHGMFAVATLLAAMGLRDRAQHGLALGAWGAVQATAMGVSVAVGGLLRDGTAQLAARGALGEAMRAPSAAYSVVYHLEILLLFATLVSLGPLVAPLGAARPVSGSARLGLADLPG
jgi:BCD family chlorophyll transporter-like MFS transporter